MVRRIASLAESFNSHYGSMRRILLIVFLGVALAQQACGADATLKTQANVIVEVALEAQREHDDPFNSVTVDVVFREPSGKSLRVPAFWAGGKKWKARYASPIVGTHRFRIECSDSNDVGLHAVAGK